MSNSVKFVGLTKKYLTKTALENINFEFKEGKIYGLLGPNGSGKTTLMKLVAGLHKETSGKILVNDAPISYKSKAVVAYMSTENFLYETFSVKDIVNFFNDMYKDFNKDKALKLLEKMKIDTKSTIKSLSSGLLAKVKIVLTVSRDASIYLFDEPLNGIDIIAREDIINCINETNQPGKIMIISSHIVDEIEKLFDEVVFIKDNKIALAGNAEQLRQEHEKSIENIYKEVYR